MTFNISAETTAEQAFTYMREVGAGFFPHLDRFDLGNGAHAYGPVLGACQVVDLANAYMAAGGKLQDPLSDLISNLTLLIDSVFIEANSASLASPDLKFRVRQELDKIGPKKPWEEITDECSLHEINSALKGCDAQLHVYRDRETNDPQSVELLIPKPVFDALCQAAARHIDQKSFLVGTTIDKQGHVQDQQGHITVIAPKEIVKLKNRAEREALAQKVDTLKKHIATASISCVKIQHGNPFSGVYSYVVAAQVAVLDKDKMDVVTFLRNELGFKESLQHPAHISLLADPVTENREWKERGISVLEAAEDGSYSKRAYQLFAACVKGLG